MKKPKQNNQMVFGKRPVEEVLNSCFKIEKIIIAEHLKKDRSIQHIVNMAAQRKIKCEFIIKDNFPVCEDVKNAQGICAVVGKYEYFNLDELIKIANDTSNKNSCSLIVICDHITDVHNLGAIIRSAESVGASGIVVPNARSASVNTVVFKTSAGAIAHMPVAQVANISQALERLKSCGFWVVGASEKGESCIWESNFKGNIALIFGNEQKGISNLVLKNCDMVASIPQRGKVSSLNVAQAATVFMYEWARQNELR